MKAASFIIAIFANLLSLGIFASASDANNAAGGNQYIMYLIAAVAFIVTAIVMRRKK